MPSDMLFEILENRRDRGRVVDADSVGEDKEVYMLRHDHIPHPVNTKLITGTDHPVHERLPHEFMAKELEAAVARYGQEVNVTAFVDPT